MPICWIAVPVGKLGDFDSHGAAAGPFLVEGPRVIAFGGYKPARPGRQLIMGSRATLPQHHPSGERKNSARKTALRMFDKMTTPERVEAAKAKTERVVDQLLYLLALHENNAIVVYSSTLSSQIPTSYAANAFNVFQNVMYGFEILRLCALWDRPYPDLSRESIPTIIALIDNAEVIEALVEETRASWKSVPPGSASEEPETDAAVRELLGRLAEEPARKEAAKARDALMNSIAVARKIESSSMLRSVRNLRHKHLAHSLSETSHEKKGLVLPLKYGDERKLFLDSLTLGKELHLWVNGKDFLFDNSREVARRNAEALWGSCTFKILR